MIDHIKTHWDTFMRVAMPPDAPAIQITEMRNAFYAGCAMLFAEIMEQLDNPELSNDTGGEFLSEIHAEINEFVAGKIENALLRRVSGDNPAA